MKPIMCTILPGLGLVVDGGRERPCRLHVDARHKPSHDDPPTPGHDEKESDCI